MEKVIYYPGCTAESYSKSIDKVTRDILKKLNIEYEYEPEMNCCGSVNIKAKDEFLNLLINGRNFALAEKLGLNIITGCNTCLNVMTETNKKLVEQPFLRQKVNTILKDSNLHYSGGLRIRHLLWYLLEDYGADNLKRQLTSDLSGLKVAPFYGCHMMRPKKLLNVDHTFERNDLDFFIDSIGAKVVHHSMQDTCCGFHIQKITEKQVIAMVESIHASAIKEKAGLIVTPCTECHYILDYYATKIKNKLPVLYFTQLLGLTLGMNEKELEFSRHFISPKKLLQAAQIKKIKNAEDFVSSEAAQPTNQGMQKDQEIDTGFDMASSIRKIFNR